MSSSNAPIPERCQGLRGLLRIAPVVAILAAIALSNALSQLADYARFGQAVPTWQPFVWEYSSVALIGVLLPWLDWLSRRVPLASWRWYPTVPIHLGATLVFSIVHVAGMVGLRELAYALADSSYQFGPVFSGWIYEYRKDFVTYWIIVGYLSAVGAWRHWRVAQTAAPPGGRGTAPPDGTAGRLERLVVRKLNREFMLDVAEVSRLEAAGNYVTVHADATAYRWRGSLASLVAQLDTARFVQIHRRQVVNVDHVREIQPWAHGDYRVLLDDGSFINFSRRYRSRFDARFKRAGDAGTTPVPTPAAAAGAVRPQR